MIRTKQSGLLALEQSAPEVVAKLNVAASRINDMLNDDNRRAIAQILANLDETTAVIARRSGDIDAILKNTNEATANLNKASAGLQPTLNQVDLTASKFGKVATDADAFINGDGLAQLSDLIAEMRRLVGPISPNCPTKSNREPNKLLFGDRCKGYRPQWQVRC